jgi:hypothetical protein
VYAQKSLPFQGFAMPSNRSRLHWLEAKRGPTSPRLKLAWEPDASIVGVDEIVDSVDCWDVGLDPGRYRANPGLGKVLYDGELSADRVPLSLTPGGDPVVHIEPGADGNRAVSVHVDTGPHLRVVYRADALYFGWVPKTMVRQTALSSIRTTGVGSRSRATHRVMQRKRMVHRVCDEPIPLLLGSEDDAVVVGQLDAGVAFYAWRSTRRFRRLYLMEQWLVPQGNFELLTLAEHIDHTCHAPDDDEGEGDDG